MEPRFVDLSHPLEDGMDPYPGLPRPVIEPIVDHETSRPRYEGRSEFFLGRMDTPCNVGTYLDSPFHRYREGQDLAALPLARLAGLPGAVLDADVSRQRGIGLDLRGLDLAGRAVLVRTGWDERWGTRAYWDPGPYLARASVDVLIEAGPALVGVDFWNVDDPEDPSRPAHTGLLGAGILVVEHLCALGALPREGFRFFAVPPRIVRGASFPVRAFAELVR